MLLNFSPSTQPSLKASAPDAPAEVEAVLFARYRAGNLSAREELVRRFMPLSRRLAGRYRNSGESQDDLEQVAYLGLVKAIDRYDAEQGSFVRYAVPSVNGELKRHFRDKGWGVHVPRSLQERSLKINTTIEELSGHLGRSPTVKDISRHSGFSLEEVSEALDASNAYRPAALDAPYPGDLDGDRTLGDGLGSEDEGYDLIDLDQAITPAFRALPERERAILRMRFREDLTQTEIAARAGVSQMQVSRLLRRSLERLGAAADGRAA